MRIKTAFSGILTLIVLLASSASFAEDCSWKLSRFSIDSVAGKSTTGFNCLLNGSNTVIASKTIEVRTKGNPICNISVASSYENTGSCTSPNIVDEVVRPSQCGNIAASYCSGGTGEAQGRAEYQATTTCSPCGGWSRHQQGSNNSCFVLRCRG